MRRRGEEMMSGVPARRVRTSSAKKSHLPPPPTSFGPPASPDSKSMVSSGPPPANKNMMEQEQTPRTIIRNAPTPVGRSGSDVAAIFAGEQIESMTPKTLIRDAPKGALINEASRDPFKSGMQCGPSKDDDAASLLRGFQGKDSGVDVKPGSPHNPAETLQSVPFQGGPQRSGEVVPPPIYNIPSTGTGESPGIRSKGDQIITKPLQTQVVSGVPPKQRRGRKKAAPSALAVKAPRGIYEKFLYFVNLFLSIAIFVTAAGLGALVYQLHGQKLQGILEPLLINLKHVSTSLLDLVPFK